MFYYFSFDESETQFKDSLTLEWLGSNLTLGPLPTVGFTLTPSFQTLQGSEGELAHFLH